MTGRQHEAWEEEKAGELFEFFQETILKCTNLAGELHFDKTHKWHMNLVSLYGSILELSRAIMVSISDDSSIGTPILLRSQLEAFVDFTNLAADRKYGYHMDAANISEWIKILREAQTQENPYLNGFSEEVDLGQLLIEQGEQLEKLKKDGHLPLSIFQKFERSGQIQEYKSFYNFLCCHSHNNMRALIERHVAVLDGGADIEVQFFPLTSLADMVQYFDAAVGLLVTATIRIHEALESPVKDEAQILCDELAEMRKPWTA